MSPRELVICLTFPRRVRNRLSQRAIRERRAIRIQQLEQELAQTRQNDSEIRFNELRAENDKLRNGLHATRKKLLSISTTTSSVADNILTLLDLDPAKDEPEQELEQEQDDNILPPVRPNGQAPNSDLPQQSPSTEEIMVEQQNGLRELFPEQFGPSLDLEDMAVKPTFSVRKPQFGTEIWGTPEGWYDDFLMDKISRFAPTSGALAQEVVANTNAFDSLPADGALMLSSKRSVSNFSDHLEHIFKLLRLSGIGDHFSSAPVLIHSLLHCFTQHCCPTIDYWFQITNSCVAIKTVMWWQTTKSPQSFVDMPAGHSPTPSQLVLSYPSIIDWIPDPTIRNVMITNYEAYDVDQVICDMTDSYVVEDEHGFQNQGEPLNVMEMVRRYHSPADDTRIIQPWVDSTTSHLHPQSQFLQTHGISRFKIDPSFFVKYPGLYDATAIAKRSCSSIRIHERAEVNHRPMPFTIASANAYLDMITQAKANAFR